MRPAHWACILRLLWALSKESTHTRKALWVLQKASRRGTDCSMVTSQNPQQTALQYVFWDSGSPCALQKVGGFLSDAWALCLSPFLWYRAHLAGAPILNPGAPPPPGPPLSAHSSTVAFAVKSSSPQPLCHLSFPTPSGGSPELFFFFFLSFLFKDQLRLHTSFTCSVLLTIHLTSSHRVPSTSCSPRGLWRQALRLESWLDHLLCDFEPVT